VHALCREVSFRHDYTRYGCCKALDPFGIMTKKDATRSLGAFGFNDLDLVSQNQQPLSEEAKKALFRVEEAADIPARYHLATLPEFVPRLFAVNVGRGQDGEIWWDDWFVKNGVQALAALVNEDVEALNRMDSHNQATARGAVVFRVADALYPMETLPATRLDPRVRAKAASGVARAYKLQRTQ